MRKQLTSLAAVLSLSFAGAAFAADPTAMSKDAYQAEKDKIQDQYTADKKACDGMKDNARNICKAEANGKEQVAKARLEAQYQPSPRNDERLKLARADADYDVAREKCNDQQGSAKDVCRKEAKVAYDTAKAQARAAAAGNTRQRGSRY
jgi:hypothetical protein